MSTQDNQSSLSFAQQLSRIARESFLVMAIGANLLLLLALLSYDPRDPGWSHYAYQPRVRNWVGNIGAWVADYTVAWLGAAAFVLPLLIIIPAWRWLRRRQLGTLQQIPFILLRLFGATLMLLTLSALASLHFSNEMLGFPFSAGGLSGQALGDFSVHWLNLIGATVVLWVALLVGLTLYLDTSWAAVLDRLGNTIFWVVEKVKGVKANPGTVVKPEAAPKRTERAVEVRRVKEKVEKAERVEPQLDVPAQQTKPQPQKIASAEELGVDMDGADELPPWEKPPTPSESKRNVKIVPLSQTHKPLASDDEADAKPATAPKMKLPSLELLDPPELQTDQGYTEEEVEQLSRLLEQKLNDFGVVAEVVEVNPGPVITRFEIQPAPGVKASKISNLARDLARSMAVAAVRVVEVIPGKSVVGIEIPNHSRQMVRLSEVLNSRSYLDAASKLTLALGNDIAGNPVVANLAKMPHLLVAGTTGSGKSVGVNAMLLSLLYKATPEQVRLMLVDPKMLELSIYDGIPHLLTPVITDMKEAAGGLRWCVAEMERRYRLMAKVGVRNIAGYNDKVNEAAAAGTPLRDPLWNPIELGLPPSEPAPELETLPYIVVVIDEFADMMMIVGKKVEELIARIAQKARAAGIHLILATQRPSVDVITGLIKANVPTRIAFQVSSKIDSRTILDQAGAENLLGNGDMLYLPAGTSVPNRVHGAFVGDDEVHRVVEAWKAMGEPVFIDAILNEGGGDAASGGGGAGLFDDEADPLYDEAVAFVTESRKASISSVQRKLKIGYNRAARMIETMEAAGVVTEAGSNGQREVLAPPPPRD
ncbi:MAG: DNA translocase FtsK 4TM domain-containing protein [Oceanospirillaceae bacterium]|nr:DNA translocase FtsK 4TM domain-containing protein [Oceanospirillaceae bacterium]